MALDYSIVIPAYNEEAFLPSTLHCVVQAMEELPEYRGEIIVCDNNSTDGTARVGSQFGARVVFEEHRQIARSRNAGANQSKARFLIFLDADTLLTRELLEKTLETLLSGEVCGGGAVVSLEREVSAVVSFYVKCWNGLSKRLNWAAGSYLFCLREAFVGTGGFNERFYAGEEVAFSRALKKWGRPKKLRVTVLDLAVTTSARKMEWYTPWQLTKSLVAMGLNPFSFRSRKKCWLWYERPPGGPSHS